VSFRVRSAFSSDHAPASKSRRFRTQRVKSFIGESSRFLIYRKCRGQSQLIIQAGNYTKRISPTDKCQIMTRVAFPQRCASLSRSFLDFAAHSTQFPKCTLYICAPTRAERGRERLDANPRHKSVERSINFPCRPTRFFVRYAVMIPVPKNFGSIYALPRCCRDAGARQSLSPIITEP